VHTIRLFCIVIISCALISACAQPIPKTEPKFSGRLLLLAGDKTNGADLVELTAGSDSTYKYSTITTGVFEAVGSPDGSRLLCATKEGIQLRTLLTGEVKLLVKGESYCLSWSPDGKRFSYKQTSGARTKLYASDLDGKAALIWDDSASNEAVAKSCAHWVAPEKLVFDRMGPSQMKGANVKPNTTTLATIGESVRLVDTERKWSVEGVCPVGTAAFLRNDQSQILIAKSLENPKTVNPTSGPCSGCRFVGFAAQSCVPFFLEDSSSTSSTLFSLNPTNWQRLRGAEIKQTFSPAARMLINSSARLMIVGDAPASLFLVNTESGEIVSFFPKTAGSSANDGRLLSPVPVVWIEK